MSTGNSFIYYKVDIPDRSVSKIKFSEIRDLIELRKAIKTEEEIPGPASALKLFAISPALQEEFEIDKEVFREYARDFQQLIADLQIAESKPILVKVPGTCTFISRSTSFLFN